MRLIPLLLSCLAAGCAAGNGDWPSLAYRPGEDAARHCGAVAAPVAPSETPSAGMAPPAPVIADLSALTAQADAVCRTLDGLGPRWEASAAVATRAVGAAQGDVAGGEAWNAAQMALTGLDVIGAEIDEQARTASDLVRDAELRIGAAPPADTTATALVKLRAALTRADAMALRHRTLYNRLRGRLAS